MAKTLNQYQITREGILCTEMGRTCAPCQGRLALKRVCRPYRPDFDGPVFAATDEACAVFAERYGPDQAGMAGQR
jgi:hypothetical protein